jgi:[ribosomal protein S5]-alanine N-acetyltransferase
MTTSTLDRVQTTRLILERVQPEHASELASLLLDPRIAATLWPRPAPPTEADVLDSVAAKVDHWERYGFGMWLLRDRETGRMVGRGGLQYTYTAGLNDVEAGWAIVHERWGQGLATELALACVDVAFTRLELLDIVAFTLPTNAASRRVMEKSGFEYERHIVHAAMPHVLYRHRGPAAASPVTLIGVGPFNPVQ